MTDRSVETVIRKRWMWILVRSRGHSELGYHVPSLPFWVRQVFGMRKYRVVDREVEVYATVRKVIVGPDLPQNHHHLPKQFPVLLIFSRIGVGMELRTFIRPDSPSQTDLNATAKHVV